MVEELIARVGDWWLALAVVVAVLGAGRISRVVTFDQFPPSLWLRSRWTEWCQKHDHVLWIKLLYCLWCFTPWVMLVTIGLFLLTFTAPWIAWVWWIGYSWMALSYVASMVMARDTPPGSDDDE